MFGFGKKEIKQNYYHETTRIDWEQMLDELFVQVIHPSKNGVALISNTMRKDPNDLSGTATPNLSFRMDNQASASLKECIRQFDFQDFSNLFAHQAKMKPYLYDCYRVRNLGLPNNVLVYFVEFREKKAILLFAPPVIRGELMKRVEKISSVICKETEIKRNPSQVIPRSFAPHEFVKAKFQQLKDRLNYLEDLEKKSVREMREIASLEEYVMKQLREKF